MSGNSGIAWHRNPAVRGVIFQALLVLVLIWAIATVLSNTIQNLEQRGIPTGFDFLDRVAPFAIGFSPFIEYTLGTSTYWDVFLIGIQNTILVSVLGIVAATILGFTVGILRLTPNWIGARIALIYIETFRNIPLLLQIMFWNFAVFLPSFPAPKDSHTLGDAVFLNNRGLFMPQPSIIDSVAFIGFLVALVAGCIAIWRLDRWATKVQDSTGVRPRGILYGLGGLLGLVALSWLMLGAPFAFESPELGRFSLRGGMEIPLPLFSLWFALTTYTAAFIAENVRGGIVAVPRGQTEASMALGQSRGLMLRKIIIPQAMRIIIPPTISQYLNLTKNSSLAVAVAYEELVNIWSGIALNQSGQALIIIAMTIAVYETLSLLTSAALNFYNKRMQLVER